MRPVPKPPVRPASTVTPIIPERVVFAVSVEGRQLVRYHREGRWFIEDANRRERLESVHDAANIALKFEREGGVIHSGQPGGKQFDAKVAGGHRRGSR